MANEKAKSRFHTRAVIIALVGITAILAVVMIYSGGSFMRDPRRFSSGQAPEIEFEMPTGEHTSVSKMKGQVLLLNFWASWCASCMEEMPSLRMLEEHYKDRGFVVLAFNISESKEKTRAKLAGGDMPGNLIFNFDKEFLRPYDINAIPISVLINSQGMVQKTFSGPRNWLDIGIRREIENLLK